MGPNEGVIKYQLEFTKSSSPPGNLLKDLKAWRKILYQLNLVGQDPNRYSGYGYGNLSSRIMNRKPADKPGFIITGTQTGHLSELSEEHYAFVTDCEVALNRIKAEGVIKPSSEALTHGAVYQADFRINYVFHVHNPDIWENRETLGIPTTDVNVEYGTPDMARDIQRLLQSDESRNCHIIVMAGHEDGVVSFGQSAAEAGDTLTSYLTKARQLN